MRKYLDEVFEEFEKVTTKQDRINVLRFNNSFELQGVLRGAYHPDVEYTVKSIPAYKPSILPRGMADMTIAQELNRLYLFDAKDRRRPKELTATKQEHLLIELLENLSAGEAKILTEMLQKKLKVRGLNYKLVEEAFPGLLPNKGE